MRRGIFICLMIGAITAAAWPCAGQVVVRRMGQMPMVVLPQQPIEEGHDNTSGVYVRDSAIALEKIALAARLERLRDWDKSANVYQEILEKYADRVVPSQQDPQTQIVTQYVSVNEKVAKALCKWPPEGLAVYRSRYEPEAARLLASADSDGSDVLHQVLSLYFPTDSAKQAGIRLMDFYFEQGDYPAVARLGRQLLQWHPNVIAERPMVLYRTAIAEKLSGQTDQAEQHLDELRKDFPQATGTIRGSDVLLADSLDAELAKANLVRGEEDDSWMTVGGDQSRSKNSTSTVRPGARLYTVPVFHSGYSQINEPGQRAALENNDQTQRQRGAGLGIMPAVDHGQIFFQDNARLYAIDLDSGVPLPGWAETYPFQNGAYKLPGNTASVPLGEQLCVTLTDKFVLAVMGLADHSAQMQMTTAEDSRLVCLDRQSGKEIWNVSLHSLPDAQSALHDLRMGGSPLVAGDNVYTIVHGDRGQFEDCYLACFSLDSGQFRWATFLANSNSQPVLMDDAFVVSDAVSHIAYASGRLYAITNLGAVACLDAHTGTIDWLNIYRTESPETANVFNGPMMMRGPVFAQQSGMSVTTSLPWTYNPAIVQNGKLFVLPSDSQNLFVYDAETGALVKQIQLSSLQEPRVATIPDIPDIPSTILAVKDDLVYLAGSRELWQIPWRNFDPDKPVDDTPGFWRTVDDDTEKNPQQVRGRAFITADAAYLPTQSCLLRIQLRSGMYDSNSEFPKSGWDQDEEGPGNVIVTQDHIIIAGDRQLAVYTDIDLARAKLDRQITDSPNDPDLRLHYAEVMFAAGQIDVAHSKLEEGFELLGGAGSPRPGSVRDRAFNDALSFAGRLVKKNVSTPLIPRFFDLAATAAQSTSQQVAWRLGRAGYVWYRKDRDAAAALDLYQQILADVELRSFSMPDPETAALSQAGAVAEKAITEILGTPDGRSAYQKYELEAAEKFQQAQAAANPDQLLELARVYPNSQIASQASLAAADLYESAGNSRQATLVLRRLLIRTHDQTRAPILESLARNYLKIPNHTDVAVSRLTQAANLSPEVTLRQPLVLPDGSQVSGMSLAKARDILIKFSVHASTESLPDLHLPTHEQDIRFSRTTHHRAKPFQEDSPNCEITDVDAMLVPPEGFSRNDRIVAWLATDGLLIYPIGQNKPLFNGHFLDHRPNGAAWTDGNLLVWTDTSIVLMDGASGRPKWSVDSSTLPVIRPADAPVAEDGPAEQIVQVKPVGDRIIVMTSIGRLFAVDTAAGRVAWQTRLDAAPDALMASDDFTVVRIRQDQNMELQAFDSYSGDLVGKKSFPLDGGPQNLALAADGTLVYTMPNQLCIQDLFEANPSEGGMNPRVAVDVGPNNLQMFQGATLPDQLLIHAGRIFAVANSGKQVRVFSADTGELWQYHPKNGGEDSIGVLNTNSNSPNVSLHISGNYLFVLSPRHVTGYRIDPPTEHWESGDDPTNSTNYEQMLFGKDYLAVVDHPGPRLTESNRSGNRLILNFFVRTVKNYPNKESGLLLFDPELPTINGDFTLQPVEGGLAFFTGHTIRTFLGARETLADILPPP